MRSELAGSALATIDGVEGFERGFNRLLRGAVGRVDTLTHEGLGVVESLGLEWVNLARETGHGMADAASRASASVVRPLVERVPRAA